MVLRLDISDCSVLVLCDDCPPWWRLTDSREHGERLAIAHAWDVHDQLTAKRLTDTVYKRRARRRAETT